MRQTSRLLLMGMTWSFLLAAACESRAEEPVSGIERGDRAVFLKTESAGTAENAGNGPHRVEFGTAFVVSVDSQLVLVTAKHVAEKTSVKTKMVYLAYTGESRWVALNRVRSLTAGNPWVHHRTADVSAFLIDAEKLDRDPATKKHLKELALPFETLTTKLPPRTTPLDTVGFPLSLGTVGAVSPIVARGFLASREILIPGKWGHESVLLAVPVLASGTSGSPVFQTTDDLQTLICLGLYSGYFSDEIGAKLAKIIPARFIRETVKTALSTAETDTPDIEENPSQSIGPSEYGQISD